MPKSAPAKVDISPNARSTELWISPRGTTRNAVQTSAMPERVRRTAIQSWTVRRLRIIELVVGVDVDARGCYFDGVDSLPVHLKLLANASSPVQWLIIKEHI